MVTRILLSGILVPPAQQQGAEHRDDAADVNIRAPTAVMVGVVITLVALLLIPLPARAAAAWWFYGPAAFRYRGRSVLNNKSRERHVVAVEWSFYALAR